MTAKAYLAPNAGRKQSKKRGKETSRERRVEKVIVPEFGSLGTQLERTRHVWVGPSLALLLGVVVTVSRQNLHVSIRRRS